MSLDYGNKSSGDSVEQENVCKSKKLLNVKMIEMWFEGETTGNLRCTGRNKREGETGKLMLEKKKRGGKAEFKSQA